MTGLGLVGAFCWSGGVALGTTVHYVRQNATGSNDGTSWVDAFTTLQAAIAASSSGDQVWVFQGIYHPGVSRASTFNLKDGVAIYGGFDDTEDVVLDDRNKDPRFNDTVLSGRLGLAISDYREDDDNSYHVVTAIEVGSGTILDGFTIERGYAFDTQEDPEDPAWWGAGIRLVDSHAVIRNCIITECMANAGGGAAVVSTDPGELISAPLFEDVRFIDNNAKYSGAGIVSIDSALMVSRAYFHDNGDTDPQSGHPVSPYYGGGIFSSGESGSLDVRNSLFFDNQAVDHGGAIMTENDGYIENVTVTRNAAGGTGAGAGSGLFADSIDEEVEAPCVGVINSIFWNNAPNSTAPNPSDELDPEENLTVTFSCIDGSVLGGDPVPFGSANGNINDNPQFANPGSNNFRLSELSPPRARGDSADVADLDLDRDDRVKACDVDMGAYEYTPNEGACCLENGHCEDVLAPCVCGQVYICDVNFLHDDNHGFGDCGLNVGGCCYADTNGDGVVTVADRGYISAAIGQTDPDLICLYDLNGDGVINNADRGVVSANLSQCTALPDYQDGGGCNNSTCPDPRFVGEFQGEGTFCGMGTCTTSENFMVEGGPETGVQAGYDAWYSITLDYNEIEIDGAIVFGVSQGGAVLDDVSGGLTVVTLGGSSGLALPAKQFGAGYTRREMIEIASPPSEEESGGELCSVELADGATLRLEVYLWRDNGGGDYTVWAAALTAE